MQFLLDLSYDRQRISSCLYTMHMACLFEGHRARMTSRSSLPLHDDLLKLTEMTTVKVRIEPQLSTVSSRSTHDLP